MLADPAYAHLTVIRTTSRAEVEAALTLLVTT
jgi:hypothetical protein